MIRLDSNLFTLSFYAALFSALGCGGGQSQSTCDEGCLIDEQCFESGEVNLESPCLICDPIRYGSGWSSNDGAECDDGSFCNGPDTCSGGACTVHSGDPCDDGLFCTGEEICDEEVDLCVSFGDPCEDDGIFCNGVESCDETSDACISSGNPCGAEDGFCFEEEDQCCLPRETLGCNADEDVVWLDSCGIPDDEVIEDCPDEHYTCVEGACLCAEGWFGEDCSDCIVYVDVENGSDALSGRSWDHAFASIQPALNLAEPNGCEIWVAKGSYRPTIDPTDREATFQLRSGVDLYGGFAGHEATREERDIETNETILNGEIGGNGVFDDDNVYHVVTGADDTIIDGFTITGGNAFHTDLSDTRNRGGGIFNYECSPTIRNCTITGNRARYGGGGIYSERSLLTVENSTFTENITSGGGAAMFNSSASPIVTDCTFTENDATDEAESGFYAPHSGGGIFNENVTILITNSTFLRNSATISGGAMYNIDESSVFLTDCTFRRNLVGEDTPQSVAGGAMRNFYSFIEATNCTFEENEARVETAFTAIGGAMSNSSTSLIFTDCSFQGNVSEMGGALHFASHYSVEASLILTNCSFLENISVRSGGAIRFNSGELVVTNSTFTRNETLAWGSFGGGMYVSSLSPGTVFDCTFTENSAVGGGGGIATHSPLLIENCTFTENSGSNGGGLKNFDSSTVTNCIFSGNSAGYGGAMHNSDSAPIVTNCTFFENSGSSRGGALYNHNSSAEVTNCTFFNNSCDGQGGAIQNWYHSSANLTNCIIWGNTAPDEPQIHNYLSTPTITSSNVQGGYPGDGNIDEDPLFVDEGAFDLRLLEGSPCIDAGDESALPADITDLDDDENTDEALPFDLDENPRVSDGDEDGTSAIDMGAYEAL